MEFVLEVSVFRLRSFVSQFSFLSARAEFVYGGGNPSRTLRYTNHPGDSEVRGLFNIRLYGVICITSFDRTAVRISVCRAGEPEGLTL